MVIFSSIIDQYFGLQFDTETKCIESESEPPTKATEHFLQFNCYIDKEVKYLMSGLKNVNKPILTAIDGLMLTFVSASAREPF